VTTLAPSTIRTDELGIAFSSSRAAGSLRIQSIATSHLLVNPFQEAPRLYGDSKLLAMTCTPLTVA
jgi:hypothetical protein